MPVIQGRHPGDYERCAEALAHMTERTGLVGVGSMCRRPVHGADGLIAVVDRLDQILPRRTRLHLFGVKGDAIPYLTARSEEHTSELQSLMRISYAVFCLKNKKHLSTTHIKILQENEQPTHT